MLKGYSPLQVKHTVGILLYMNILLLYKCPSYYENIGQYLNKMSFEILGAGNKFNIKVLQNRPKICAEIEKISQEDEDEDEDEEDSLLIILKRAKNTNFLVL